MRISLSLKRLHPYGETDGCVAGEAASEDAYYVGVY